MPKRLEDWLGKYDVCWVTSGAIAIAAVGFGFWITQPNVSVQLAIVSVDATAMVAWFASVATWHARRQVGVSREALDVAEKQAEISSRAVEVALKVGLATAHLNALSALADYYKNHANVDYQSKEATQCAEEIQRVLEKVKTGEFGGAVSDESTSRVELDPILH